MRTSSSKTSSIKILTLVFGLTANYTIANDIATIEKDLDNAL
ncbi:hypothetical protein [Ostreibacterium oceani]|nr:hypothetical protein [Ostreibacterium oceani]